MALDVPCLKKLSTQPTLYEQVPDLLKVATKLRSVTRSLDSPISDTSLTGIADIIRAKDQRTVTEEFFADFREASDAIAAQLPPEELFPLLDFWRLALVREGFTARCVLDISGLTNVLKHVAGHINQLGPSTPKALALTSLRLEANVSANPVLLRQVMQERENRTNFTQILIAGLLHADTGVRATASMLAFNVGAHLQRSRRQAPARPDPVEDGDWEVEVLTALLETLSTESDSGTGETTTAVFFASLVLMHG
jgi:hypothetical protein